MITYIYGTDRYRIREYLREHAPNAGIGPDALKYQSLFDDTRSVIIHDPAEDLEIPTDKNLNVFVVYPSDKKGKKKKDAIVIDNLGGAELKAWIAAQAKKNGFTIASDAAALIAERSTDTWQAKLELEKACNYVRGPSITAQDVEAVTSASPLLNIFQFTDALGSSDKRQAYLLLSHQLREGTDPYYLFSMIVFQFRNIVAPKRSGVHPYAAQKAAAQAKRFEPSKLKNIYRSLHQLEIDNKTGKRDMEDGLYSFVFSL